MDSRCCLVFLGDKQVERHIVPEEWVPALRFLSGITSTRIMLIGTNTKFEHGKQYLGKSFLFPIITLRTSENPKELISAEAKSILRELGLKRFDKLELRKSPGLLKVPFGLGCSDDELVNLLQEYLLCGELTIIEDDSVNPIGLFFVYREEIYITN